MVKFILIVTALDALVQGHVLPDKRALTPAICTTVNRLVTAAKQQAGATAFCSSYLSTPVVTVPKTVSTETKTATNFAVVYTGSRVFTATSDGAPFVRFQLECPASNQGQRAVARIDEVSVQPVVIAT